MHWVGSMGLKQTAKRAFKLPLFPWWLIERIVFSARKKIGLTFGNIKNPPAFRDLILQVEIANALTEFLSYVSHILVTIWRLGVFFKTSKSHIKD